MDNKMSIKAIFWDNDGVLVDTEHLYYDANRIIFEEEGHSFDMNDYIDISLKQGQSSLNLLKAQGYSQKQIGDLRVKRNQVFSDLLNENGHKLLLKNVKETLEILSKKYLMAIVTTCRKDHFKIIHRHTGTLHYFDFILANGDYPRSKPAPDPYLCALEKSGFKKEECIIVEDTERGLKAANAAGINCLVIPHELSKSGNFDGAYKVLSSITEVPAILNEM